MSLHDSCNVNKLFHLTLINSQKSGLSLSYLVQILFGWENWFKSHFRLCSFVFPFQSELSHTPQNWIYLIDPFPELIMHPACPFSKYCVILVRLNSFFRHDLIAYYRYHATALQSQRRTHIRQLRKLLLLDACMCVWLIGIVHVFAVQKYFDAQNRCIFSSQRIPETTHQWNSAFII